MLFINIYIVFQFQHAVAAVSTINVVFSPHKQLLKEILN